jgi:hypothetical protein
MSAYLAYWKRGWWAWLLMAVANISVGILAIPLALAFEGNKVMYLVSALVAWMLIGAPCWGWLFEVFAKHSIRIGVQSTSDVAADFSSEQRDAPR